MNPEQSQQQEVPQSPEPLLGSLPATGRPAFRQLKRELADEDLESAGARKLILEMLLTAETERDEYRTYVTRYHAEALRTAVLEEKLKGDQTNEIMFAVGIGVGGAFIALAPVFWDRGIEGIVSLVIGVLLTAGALLGRYIFRKTANPITK